MTPNELLQECETLTHQGRMRRMVEIGRMAASDPSVRETLAALAGGEVYPRILATQACYGSLDSAQIARALSDPSRSVRALALDLAALVCSDTEIQSLLPRLPLDLQRVLVRNLCRRRRQAPIDQHLEMLAERSDTSLKELLPYGSPSLVARVFAQIHEQFDLVSLVSLARVHPALVVAHLHRLAQALTTLDPQLVFQVNTLLPTLAKHTPDLAFGLVQALLPLVPLARLQLQFLVRKRPQAVVDLVLASEEECTLRFDTIVHRLDTERLLALFTRYPGTVTTRYFQRLRPEQRLALYTACERGWRNSDGVLPLQVVAGLPTAEREREGRRHLELPALETRPQERFPYAAFLPWDEARELLDTPLRSPDAELRGFALKALIGATRYQRAHLANALALVRKRRNEQDPVRGVMLTALAELPHGIWQPAHLDDLAQIIKDALDATDLSYQTAQAMERLVVHTFPFYAEWAALQLAAIYRARGRVSVYRLEAYLSDTHVRSLASVLTPILQSWQSRESEGLLLALASALGKRLSVFTELAELLEATVNQTPTSYIADSMLRLLVEHCRARVYLLIPRLLKNDQSTITLSSVSAYLHRYRQDLLTPFLGQQAYKGRFSTGRTRFVLPLHDGFYRWTPKQQQMFSQTLLEIVHATEKHRAVYEWLATINRLALMPAINVKPLLKLASDERPPVREAALRALGRLDAGQGVSTLLEALNDERARIAIYALRGALLTMPQDEALKLLREAPLTQVTVAKEVIRLIGELASEAAYRELISWETRDLHRDVRVALLRALWDYLDRPETWEIFTRAAQSPDTALARGVVHVPADSLSSLTQQRMAALTATLLAHPTSEVRMATLTWRALHPLADHEHILFTRLLALMNSPRPDECEKAAQTVFATYTGNDAQLVGEAMRELISNRRALYTICGCYLDVVSTNRLRLVPTTHSILAVLSADRLTISFRVRIVLKGLPWEEIAPELLKIASELHADALNKAATTLEGASARPDARLFELETTLAASSDERLRRLALSALIAQARQPDGWSEAAIARLQTYRDDPSPLVAEAAQFTFEA